MAVAPTMTGLAKATAPVVWFLSVSNELVLKLIRADTVDEPSVTEEEVRVMLRHATDAGIFGQAEQEMVRGVFGLGDRTAGELMTPRHNIVFLDLTDPEDVNRAKMSQSDFHHYPVCEQSTDNVLGIVSARDLWQRHLSGQEETIRGVLKPALFVPEILPVLDVLRQMRDVKTQVAIVIDEYGGVDGLITLNDVLGSLVDEIGADHGSASVEGAQQREDGSWLVDGVFAAHEVRELFDIKQLAGEEEGHFETIGGYVLDQLGHIPVAGEAVTADGYRIEVVYMDGHRIDKVLIVPPDTATPPELPTD